MIKGLFGSSRVIVRDDNRPEPDLISRLPTPIQLIIKFEILDAKSNLDRIWIGLNLDIIGYNPTVHFYSILALFFFPILFLLRCKCNIKHLFNVMHIFLLNISIC